MEKAGKVDILVVDDQTQKLLTYEAILAPLGERILRAGSGREALELLLKREFLAMLAHELRNPLATILNAMEILRMPNAEERVRERAREMAKRQVQHLTRLLDDLLDISRITRGKIVLHTQPVFLPEAV